MTVLITRPAVYYQRRHSEALGRAGLGLQPAIWAALTTYVTCWISTFGLEDGEVCVRQEIELHQAVNPSQPAEHLLRLFQPLNQIGLAHMQQQQKSGLRSNGLEKRPRPLMQ